jgi:hypothetical protein
MHKVALVAVAFQGTAHRWTKVRQRTKIEKIKRVVFISAGGEGPKRMTGSSSLIV